MIRSLEQFKNGLGELTMRPETDDEIRELERVCPRELPAGVIHGYRWNDKGHLVLFTRDDPDYRPPAPAPKPDDPRVRPVPTKDQLADMPMPDLVTRAAELGVVHRVGETKAALIAKIIPAWEKANAEADKPKPPVGAATGAGDAGK